MSRGVVVIALGVAACATAGHAEPPYAPPPASTILDDPGTVKIRREVFLVEGVAAPPNPVRNVATPAEQNKVRVVRYRVDATPPKPARAVVVMMPGFLAGTGSFDGLARALVRRSTEGDAIEAWAIDRRANLLEDTHGLDVAEVRHDPSIAQRYYLDGETVEGKTFGGYIPDGAPHASEWGLATALGDLRRVIKSAGSPAHVVLLGHSLGADMAEEYAAWDFGPDGRGMDDAAAFVMLDGGTGDEGKPGPSVDKATYESSQASAAFGVTGLGAIRQGDTLTQLPFLGTKALVVAEYIAMRSRWSGAAIVADDARDALLGTFLGLTAVPKMTNRAAFALAFDDASSGLTIAAVSCGAATGGAMTSYQSAFGATLFHPSDPSATYDWVSYDKTVPAEVTSADDFARAWYDGPGLNLAEWYFPKRLSLDVPAAGTLVVGDQDWQMTYGLAAKHGHAIDKPILAIAFALEKSESAFDGLKATVAHPDKVITAAYPTLTHVDGLMGVDAPGSLPAQVYDKVASFVRSSTPTGGDVLPIR